MIPSIKKGIRPISSAALKAVAVKWRNETGDKIRMLHGITSPEDIQKCPVCQLTIDVATVRLYGQALSGANTYSEIRRLSKGCIFIEKDDFFVEVKCLVSRILRGANNLLIRELQTNVMYYDDETTEVIMSAFLRRGDLKEGESDLTGDNGKLALEILGPDRVGEFNGYVVDIGGQDPSYVKEFPNAGKRVVMDINAIAWALDKSPGVFYALGSADKIFRDSRFLSEEQRPKTIFTMSNFINVLSPGVSWQMLDATIGRMQPGDTLAITNLYRDNFLEDSKSIPSEGSSKLSIPKQVKSKYREGRSQLGIYEFNKAKTGEHYKSTIGDDFVVHMQHVHPDLELLQQKRSSLDCKVRDDKVLPVKFITLEFVKRESAPKIVQAV